MRPPRTTVWSSIARLAIRRNLTLAEGDDAVLSGEWRGDGRPTTNGIRLDAAFSWYPDQAASANARSA
jgi:hypothetical protein